MNRIGQTKESCYEQGALAYESGNFANAAEWFKLSVDLALAETNPDHNFLIKRYIELAEIFYKSGDAGQALIYGIKGYDTLLQLG